MPHGLGVGLSEPHPPRFLVERASAMVCCSTWRSSAEGAGLIRRQRAAELAADLLQLLGVDLAELLGRNLGAADLGQRRLAESLEDVGDAPDCRN